MLVGWSWRLAWVGGSHGKHVNATINSYKGNLGLYINSFKRIINNLEANCISLPSNFVAALLLNNLNEDYEYIVTIITQTIRFNNSTKL